MNHEITKSTLYMVRILLFSSLLTFLASTGYAQRDYFYRDSTIYQISPTIQYIAGKRTLYKNEANTITLIKDFTVTNDTTFYIRDVDFVNDRKGYVLVGSMYIGNLTQLYKTENGGLNWELDTSFYAASERKSINQMQVLDSNTFVLFDGYYTSSLIRSFDGGKTWTKWFESLIAHYFQLHKCSNGTFYLIGLPGDGFSSYSFPIPDSLWNKNNINFMSGCHNGAPGCIHVYRDGDRDRATDFIAKQIDTLTEVCGNTTGLFEFIREQKISIYPNPTTNYIVLSALPNVTYSLYHINGNLLLREKTTSYKSIIRLEGLPPGCYYLHAGNCFQKIIKQ
jgi:hypothetical protein